MVERLTFNNEELIEVGQITGLTKTRIRQMAQEEDFETCFDLSFEPCVINIPLLCFLYAKKKFSSQNNEFDDLKKRLTELKIQKFQLELDQAMKVVMKIDDQLETINLIHELYENTLDKCKAFLIDEKYGDIVDYEIKQFHNMSLALQDNLKKKIHY